MPKCRRGAPVFNIGDEVEIRTLYVPNRHGDGPIPRGTVGVITALQKDTDLSYYVEYPGCSAKEVYGRDGWYFGNRHLKMFKEKTYPMQDPEFNLDELELAEKIIGDV